MFTKLFTKQQTRWLPTNKKVPAVRRLLGLSITVLFIIYTGSLISCSSRQKEAIVIWTNDFSVVSYVELFNHTHTDARAIAVYKENPIQSIPPAKNEATPDIIIGPWLKSSSTRKNFSPVDYLFAESELVRSEFYTQLIDYGVINDKQYLLPVSFNLPTMVFSLKNEELIFTEHFLTLEQIRDIAADYNKTNAQGNFTAIGYAPSWNNNFLYLATKLNGASYSEKGPSFSYDSKAIDSTIDFLKNWTKDINESTTTESNFHFKYLYTSDSRQVSIDRCLFTYMPSNEFFTLSNEQSSELSFRWISKNNSIPVEDNVITMGLFKHSKNKQQAEKFITWFFDQKNQKDMMDRLNNMNIDSKSFGIAGGFSALKSVNEQVYPSFYRQLLGNVPSQNHFEVPSILPSHWISIKEKVIIPYLSASTNTDLEEKPKTLEERIQEWNRQNF